MASIITATTTSGLTQSADNSGVLQLASGTGNLVTIPSVTGTAMVSGNMPAFAAWQSAQQTSVSNTTWTKVTLTTELFDTNNNYASSRFTPTIAGYYQINGSVCMVSTTSTHTVICALFRNGALYWQGQPSVANTNFYPQSNISSLMYFNGSTDYVELYVYGNAGGTFNIYNTQENTNFSACLVRAA